MKRILAMSCLVACGGSPASPPAAGPASPPAAPEPTPSAEHPDAHHHAEHSHGAHDHMTGPEGHRFERAEEWAPRFDNPERDAWQRPDLVIKQMSLQQGMIVADLGAGTGYFLPHLSRAVGAGGRVIGLDIEPDMVRYMTERAAKEGLSNVQARVVKTDDPTLAEGSVDRILIVDTWHHIGERTAYARKLAAALDEGGRIYIVDFTMKTKRGPPPAHRLSPATVIAELQAAGLTAALMPANLPDQYMIEAR